VGAQPCLLEMVVLEHQEGPGEAQVCHWVEQLDWRGRNEGGRTVMGAVLRGRFHSCERRAVEGRDLGLRSGDNAQSEEHREGELDRVLI